MNTRRWLVSVLVMLLGWGCISGVQAQGRFRSNKPKLGEDVLKQGSVRWPASDRVSHLPINTDLADLLAPDERLRERLKGLQPDDKALPKDVQDLARRLIRDPKLLETLRKQFSDDDLKRLQEKLSKEGAGNDPELKKLFEEVKTNLTPKDKELLKRWGETLKNPDEKSSPKENPDKASPDKPLPPPTPSEPAADATEKAGPAWNRLQEETPDWLKNKIEGLVKNSNWVDAFMDRNWRDTLRDLAKRVGEERGQASALADRASGFTRYLPKASDYLPRNLLGRTPEGRFPTLPRFGGLPQLPQAPNWPSLPAPSPGKFVLWVVVLGVLAAVFWRAGSWWQQVRAAQASAWKLGPWPVRPGGVTTRADLVRAFEYLALLCLGQEARTCHHLELADRIGEQPALDPDRRRTAASTLAGLYEQARYTPDEERLSPEMMASARRELSYLAGVATV